MKRPKQKSLAILMADCSAWNDAHRVGTSVIYHPIIGQKSSGDRPTVTISEAYVLGHTAVVNIAGVAGCVALDAVEVVA